MVKKFIYKFKNRYITKVTRDILLRWLVAMIVGLLSGILGAFTVSGILPLNVGVLLIAIPVGGLIVFAIGHLRYWLLALLIIDVPYAIDIHLFWDQGIADVNGIGGMVIALTTFVLILLYSLWVMELLYTSKRVENPPAFGQAWIVLPYVGIVCLSALWALQPKYVLNEASIVIHMFFLFIYLAGNIRDRKDFTFLLSMMIFALIAEASYVLFQRFLGGDITIIRNNIYDYRAAGHFGSPNITGGYLAVMIITCVGVLALPINNILRGLAGFAVLLGTIAIATTLSRGAFVGLACGLMFWIIAMLYRRWLSLYIPIIIGVVLLAVVLLFGDLLVERITGGDRGAALSRLSLSKIALSIIDDYPLMGVGANNFGIWIPEYVGLEYTGKWVSVVHNKYLLVWSELGLFGFLSFIFILGITLYRGIQVWLFKLRYESILALSLTAAICSNLVHMMVDIFNYRGPVQMLWIHLSLVTALFLSTKYYSLDTFDC
jgi:O-antigen ligase